MGKEELMAKETSEDEFKYYTQKAGDIARQLSLAGVAIIWLFHTTVPGASNEINIGIPIQFRLPVLLFVVSLGLDAVQYLVGSFLWGLAFHDDPEGNAYQNKCKNIAAIIVPVLLIFAKLGFMAAAYWYFYDAIQEIIVWQFPSTEKECLTIGCTWTGQSCALPCQ